VKSDHIAGADEVGLRAVEENEAIAIRIPERVVAVRAQADEIVLKHIAAGAGAGHVETISSIARNHIGRERIVLRGVQDVDTREAVGNCLRARYISADYISLDEIEAGARIRDDQSGGAVAGNNIARREVRATDQVPGRARVQGHTGKTIGNGVRAE